MDEQVSWKGQSFTLLVFGGIVFLCSIFFVLGMLVGRGQGEKAAEAARITVAAKAADSEARLTDSKPVPSPYSGIATGSPTSKDSSKDSESLLESLFVGLPVAIPEYGEGTGFESVSRASESAAFAATVILAASAAFSP